MHLIKSDISSNPLIFVFERHNYKPYGLAITINCQESWTIRNLVELSTESNDMIIISYDIAHFQRNHNYYRENHIINYKYIMTNNAIKTWVDGIKTRTIKIKWDKL
jgi:hypothetical protein